MFKLRIFFNFYAQNELISNLMPATGLKKFGTGACLPWCSISSSFQNSLKTSGHRGYEFLEFWSWNFSIESIESKSTSKCKMEKKQINIYIKCSYTA